MPKILWKGPEVVLLDSDGEEVSRYRLELLRKTVRLPYRGSTLRLIAFSDWRVQDIRELIRFVREQERADLILYAGDDISRFRPAKKNYFQEIAKLSRFGLCAVAGNDDRADTRTLIAGRNVYAVHSCALVLGNFAVVGVDGAPLSKDLGPNYNIGYLLYPEAVLARQMERWTRLLGGKKLIVVSHTPPYGVLDFAVRFGPRSIGSRPLQKFLSASSAPVLCVCGHVHRCGGQHARLGTAVVVNAASHDSAGEVGKVAIIQIRDDSTSVEWHQI
jgi:Icc-related predicted phosphoesterase